MQMLSIKQDEVVQLAERANEIDVNEGSALSLVSNRREQSEEPEMVLKGWNGALESLGNGLYVVVANEF